MTSLAGKRIPEFWSARTLPVFIMASMLLCIGLPGSSRAAPASGKKGKKPPLVKAVLANRSRISRTLDVTGDVVATNTATLSATVEGPIRFCPWREGDTVEKGEKLVVVDRPLYRAEVSAARAALVVAEAKLADLKAGTRPEEIAKAEETVKELTECSNFTKSDQGRIAKLVTNGSLSAESLDKARVAKVKCETQLAAARKHLAMLRTGPTATEIAVLDAAVAEAKAKLDMAKAKLAECIIAAPFSGIITNVNVRVGDLAVPRAPLLELMDPGSLVVRFAVPEQHVAALKNGMHVEVCLDAFPGRVFPATVRRMYPELDPATRTELVEADVGKNSAPLAGMFARVRVPTETVADAVVVPDSAVLSVPGGARVVFVFTRGMVHRRVVETGIEQGARVQIVKGVEAGEMVVTAGNQKLKDGMKVRLMGAKKDLGSGKKNVLTKAAGSGENGNQ